ncbi:MAG: ribosomal protein S18-alanine N-acetyltransferase [Planctomycetia bacterium]|nr:ribosomal protein S18-alanine N-acetyltransferase [Planctomycetia bacterium]
MNSVCAELLQIHLRWMKGDDLNRVYEIEQQTASRPWLPLEFARILNHPHCVGMVAEHEGEIVGFIIYELTRQAFRLWNIAVLPEFQRQGVGSQMLARVACRLDGSCRHGIRLEVQESNLAAQLFFRSLGFRAVSIQRSPSNDQEEDVYVMQYCHRRPRLVAA